MTESLAFDVHGSGPGLVLLHGTGSSGLRTWNTILGGLAAQHTVVLPNLPGSGGSPLPAAGTSLDLDVVADQVVSAARNAGLERFALAGASLGGALAVRAAIRHPEFVTRLITVAGFARPRPTLRLNLQLLASMYTRGDDDASRLITSLSFAEDYLDALPEGALQQVLRQIGELRPELGTTAQIELALSIDVRDDLPRLRVPTLVLTATGDRFVAPAHAYEIAAAVPDGRLVEIPGGHAAHVEDPTRSLSELLTFLAEGE
ncbi:alpha/beta fold hydrolase [Streptomyces sp. DvalAA-14]|uniref:alpha/beta fold hydrolase n=1 Tax=Streptomyces sp. DvalAA-14 TaxID=1839759 RepID=UPI000B80375A|nr:alpha/beta hydrolase [Streptomyces sp. DvalAA-14]MYS22591.1 alpha/beta fold hydrolase [Streptomyces sp. SID4948]